MKVQENKNLASSKEGWVGGGKGKTKYHYYPAGEKHALCGKPLKIKAWRSAFHSNILDRKKCLDCKQILEKQTDDEKLSLP